MEKKEYMKNWRIQNKLKIQEYIAKYKKENRERVLAVQRILNHKNYIPKPKKQKEFKSKPNPKPKPRFQITKGIFIQF